MAKVNSAKFANSASSDNSEQLAVITPAKLTSTFTFLVYKLMPGRGNSKSTHP